jgi:hypothetical protein
METTSWAELPVRQVAGGRTVQLFPLGAPGTTGAPIVVRVSYPAGSRVERHSHACDFAEIILEGSVQCAGSWFHAGDIMNFSAGTPDGPLVAGPDGVTKLVVYADDRVVQYDVDGPTPPDAELRLSH